ncbi:MAG: hypothetical protein U5K43_15485 [Halofilum sp. (in: g-proteobacteria)]|nr:hypothetical protein [Halofilum sp. (in: g-proteobacteria)]
MARPRRGLPRGARDYILAAAENGPLRETAIARGLGLHYDTWRRILRDDPDAAALWKEALAHERDNLVEKMYHRAAEGDVQAGRLLLAVRHGMRENAGAGDDSGRGGVTINLPPSMSQAGVPAPVRARCAPGAGGQRAMAAAAPDTTDRADAVRRSACWRDARGTTTCSSAGREAARKTCGIPAAGGPAPLSKDGGRHAVC